MERVALGEPSFFGPKLGRPWLTGAVAGTCPDTDPVSFTINNEGASRTDGASEKTVFLTDGAWGGCGTGSWGVGDHSVPVGGSRES